MAEFTRIWQPEGLDAQGLAMTANWYDYLGESHDENHDETLDENWRENRCENTCENLTDFPYNL